MLTYTIDVLCIKNTREKSVSPAHMLRHFSYALVFQMDLPFLSILMDFYFKMYFHFGDGYKFERFSKIIAKGNKKKNNNNFSPFMRRRKDENSRYIRRYV